MIEREQASRIAQFELLCSNIAWFLSGAFFAALILCVVLIDHFPNTHLIVWFVALTAILIARAILLRQWLREPATAVTVQNRIRIATLMSSITAAFFGMLAYFAVSVDHATTSLLIIMVLTGMVATATAAISYLLPMYLLYIFPMMLPVSARMSGFAESSFQWIAILILLYLTICVGISRKIRYAIIHSINVRFENIDLLQNVQHEKKRSEEALERAEQANLAKSRFLAAASHDLRQPLHSLRLFTATLELQTRETQHKTLVSQIDTSVKSLEELFNSLLDISKLDAGTINVDRQHVQLDLLLTQIEGEFRPVAQEKRLDLQVTLDGHVVHTDALLLERLIRNLASNAIRYTSDGTISIGSTSKDGRVWIGINDTGIGIEHEDQTRIFEEFVQLGNVERDRNQGIGLGLSIVKRIGDLLDVDLKLTSSPGQGSTFLVGVPEGDSRLSVFSNTHGGAEPDHVDSLFVLVIDDEEAVCLAVEGLLETWGCIVMTATSGDAALQQLTEIGETPDLILSDYRLRDGETGGDAIKRIRELYGEDVPAIILTGDIAPDRLKDIKLLGLPMLHKPCEPEALRQLLVRETQPRTLQDEAQYSA